MQDGARPLVTPEVIDRVVKAAARCGAAAPAVAVKDTVKVVREGGAVEQTPDRSALRAVQTPQVFEASLLKAALQDAVEKDLPITDDCLCCGASGQDGLPGGGRRGEHEDHHASGVRHLAEAILQSREGHR